MYNVKLVATDLDGTFLKNDRSISKENIRSLKLLKKHHIKSVAATGRNLKKVKEVIPPDTDFDYIVFSSGAGVYDWKNNTYLLKQNLSAEVSVKIARFLQKKDLNFNAFWAVPDNNNLWYHRGSKPCEEFERYFSFHNSFASELPKNGNIDKNLCQFLVILPNAPDAFERLKAEILKKFPEICVIRSTSPLGTGFIWMEIFHKSVSKGNGVSFICEKYGINQNQTLGIGNDYNDLELLKFTNKSFLVENAPNDLKSAFAAAPSNENNAFSFVVNQLIKS